MTDLLLPQACISGSRHRACTSSKTQEQSHRTKQPAFLIPAVATSPARSPRRDVGAGDCCPAAQTAPSVHPQPQPHCCSFTSSGTSCVCPCPLSSRRSHSSTSSGRASLGKQSKKGRIQGQSHGVAMRGSRRSMVEAGLCCAAPHTGQGRHLPAALGSGLAPAAPQPLISSHLLTCT